MDVEAVFRRLTMTGPLELPLTSQTARANQAKAEVSPIILIALFATVFQANFYLGSLLLSPARIFYLIFTPILFFGLIKGRYGKVSLIDVFMMIHIFLIVVTIFMHHPTSVAVTYTGSNVILIFGAYLAGRTLIQSEVQMRGMIKVLVGLIIFSLPFAIVETRTGTMTLARLIDLVPGLTGNRDVNYTLRFGFDRVQFLFSHPIHYGLFASTGFALCFIGMRPCFSTSKRILLSLGIIVATFLSVSSGPFLSLGGQVFLILWSLVFARLHSRWWLLFSIFFVLYLLMEIASNRPAIYVIVSKLAFAPYTANLRLLLFQYGVEQIYRAPIFGIGFNPFPLPHFMSGSIDNHWLLLCVVFGVPCCLALVSIFVCIFWRLGKIKNPSVSFNDLRLSWCITLISLILTLATVALWTEMLSLFYFMIGCGVWMTNHNTVHVETQNPPESDLSNAVNTYSRFPVVKSISNSEFSEIKVKC